MCPLCHLNCLWSAVTFYERLPLVQLGPCYYTELSVFNSGVFSVFAGLEPSVSSFFQLGVQCIFVNCDKRVYTATFSQIFLRLFKRSAQEKHTFQLVLHQQCVTQPVLLPFVEALNKYKKITANVL